MLTGKSQIVRPSYHQGFARSAGESQYPESWKGLAAAWAPFLGVTGGRLLDPSGYANHGTLTNMDLANAWVLEKDGWALAFATNDYIKGGTGLDFVSNDITVHLKIKPSSVTGGQRIWTKARSVTATSYGVWLNNDNIQYFIQDSGGTSVNRTYVGLSLSVGVEYDITVVWVKGDTAYLYVDGILVDSISISAVGNLQTGFLWTIGTRDNAPTTYDYNGLIYLVYVYSRALCAAEVAWLYRKSHAMFELRRRPAMFVPTPLAGAVINQFQGPNLGADLYNGTLM